MALAIDASSPAAVVGATATTTTASFSPPANSLLVAFIEADANSGATGEQCTVTSTGGLSWSLAGRHNGSPGATVEVWSAQAVSAPGSITVSVTDNQGSVDKRLFVRVFTDTGIPAGIGATSTSAATSVAYTSTAANSWGWAVGLGGGGAPTAGASQTLQDSDTALDGGDGTWVIDQNATTATPGTTVTMSVTAPGTVVHHLAVEVLPVSTAATNYAGPWTGPTPSRRGPTGQWRVALGDASTQASANATAEITAATGVAFDTLTAVGVNDSGATATGAALDTTAALAANDSGATATGAAFDALGSIGAQDSGSSGTGAGLDSAVAVTANDSGAPATGAALDATVQIDWLNYAGPWTQVTPGWISPTGHLSPLLGDATAVTVAATNAPAEVAAATGAALDASVVFTANESGAAATGIGTDALGSIGAQDSGAAAIAAGFDTTVAVTANDTGAQATGAAFDATVSTSSAANAPAETAIATGIALDPSVALTVPAETAIATGAGQAATAAVTATDQLAQAAGGAFDATVQIVCNAETATATGQAGDAVGQAAYVANAGVAQATAVALDVLAQLAANADLSAALAAGLDPTIVTPNTAPPVYGIDESSVSTGMLDGTGAGTGVDGGTYASTIG